jgi:hypothetical protein
LECGLPAADGVDGDLEKEGRKVWKTGDDLGFERKTGGVRAEDELAKGNNGGWWLENRSKEVREGGGLFAGGGDEEAGVLPLGEDVDSLIDGEASEGSVLAMVEAIKKDDLLDDLRQEFVREGFETRRNCNNGSAHSRGRLERLEERTWPLPDSYNTLLILIAPPVSVVSSQRVRSVGAWGERQRVEKENGELTSSLLACLERVDGEKVM